MVINIQLLSDIMVVSNQHMKYFRSPLHSNVLVINIMVTVIVISVIVIVIVIKVIGIIIVINV